MEEREFASSNAAAQQLLETERLAHRVIENNGTRDACCAAR